MKMLHTVLSFNEFCHFDNINYRLLKCRRQLNSVISRNIQTCSIKDSQEKNVL